MAAEEGDNGRNFDEGVKDNGKVSFADAGSREFPISVHLEDEVFEPNEMNNNERNRQPPTDMPPPPPPDGDNVSVANSEVVILRHPNFNRQPKNGPPALQHSHSASDLVRLRNPHVKSNSREPKSMVLPITSRSRSPYNYSVGNSQSYDCTNPYNTFGTINRPAGSQEAISPYSTNDGGGSPNGTPNNDFPNVQFQNGGYAVSSGDFEPYKRAHTPHSTTGSHHKMPTPPEAKKRIFTDIFTTSMSTIYAILIVTLGVSFYVIDTLQLEEDRIEYLAEGFSLTLLSMALLYLLWLNVDITIYNLKKRKFDKLMENLEPEQVEIKEITEGIAYDIGLQEALALQKQLDHRYCFNNDRHSKNFYLKIGAAGFCFGHLIHSFLILTYRGLILRSEDQAASECMSVITFAIEILYPIYSITLLFFIFKYSNVIINKKRDFHRFGFMHCLASSLCFWLWTIFRETAEYIQNSHYDDYNATVDAEDEGASQQRVQIVPLRFTAVCEHDELNIIYQNYSPYLYPFSVEYSILVVGIIYLVWVNIGLCAPCDLQHEDHHGEDTRQCMNERRPSEPESNITIHADCHASNKGLFLGFIVLVFALVSLILFFITHYSETAGLAQAGLTVNLATRATIMLLMIVAAVCAYFQMVKLDVNESAHNSLDNFLCLMCLPAFFVYGTFSVIAGIIFGRVLAVVGIILEVVQVVIQTTFIVDGMSRSSNTKTLRKKKPGREFVTFLIICNVAMWIMQTFEVKPHGLDEYRPEFYSKVLWSIVGHMCLPLMMFYRFHSSVCIGDIWQYAYMPSGH
ncbi:hypothetical protein HUJ04_009305 [Dendroctonus ponderosae]|nr:hypothetical protein HUJ04_009305 [Dendroctonus ponderosae]